MCSLSLELYPNNTIRLMAVQSTRCAVTERRTAWANGVRLPVRPLFLLGNGSDNRTKSNMMKYWTIRFDKTDSDYKYFNVVATTMDEAIDWLINHHDGLSRDQIVSVSSGAVEVAQ